MVDKKGRLSIQIDTSMHTVLKMCCAQMGVSITEFVLEAVNDSLSIYLYQKESEEGNGVDKQKNS